MASFTAAVRGAEPASAVAAVTAAAAARAAAASVTGTAQRKRKEGRDPVRRVFLLQTNQKTSLNPKSKSMQPMIDVEDPY